MKLHSIVTYNESSIDMDNFNYKRLEMLMNFNEYKVKDVSKLTGISESYFYKMKSQNLQPSMNIVLKLCTLFDVKPTHFYIKSIKKTYLRSEDE